MTTWSSMWLYKICIIFYCWYMSQIQTWCTRNHGRIVLKGYVWKKHKAYIDAKVLTNQFIYIQVTSTMHVYHSSFEMHSLQSLFQQFPPPLHTQNSVHLRPWDLHPHLLVEHGLLLSHPHLITVSNSFGAIGVFSGMMVGNRTALPSMLDHPWSVGASAGGWGSRAFRHKASW